MERLSASNLCSTDYGVSHESMLEVCYINGSVQPRSSRNEDLLSKMKVIQSECIVLISYDSLKLVPIVAQDLMDITSAFMTGRKYIIKYDDVSDIGIPEIRRNVNTPQVIGVKAASEPQRGSIIIYFHKGSQCRIGMDPKQSARLAKHLQYTWQSWLVCKSASMPKLSAAANISIAQEYLAETVNSLKSKSNNSTVNFGREMLRKQQIFEEFQAEVLSDLHLKNASCQSRELFISAVNFINCLIKSSVLLDKNSSIASVSSENSSRQSTPRCPIDYLKRGGLTSTERRMQLHATALQRLIAVKSVLQVGSARIPYKISYG